MEGEEPSPLMRAAGVEPQLETQSQAQPKPDRVRRRNDFRPGEGTRKRLEKAAEDVISKFKEACRGDIKLEAPLLRHLLGDPRMEKAKKECGINVPTRTAETPKLTKRRLQIMERQNLSRQELIAQDAQTVREKHHNGSLDTLPTAVIRNFLLSLGHKTSGTKEKIIERARSHLDAEGPPGPMQGMLLQISAEAPAEMNGGSEMQERVLVAENGAVAAPVSQGEPMVTQQLLPP